MEARCVKRKRRSGRDARILILTAAAALAAVVIAVLSSAVREPVMDAACDSLMEAASRELTLSAQNALAESGELLSVMKTGEKSFIITADTAKLNAIVTCITAEAQRRVAGPCIEGASVPLGTASGIALLSGRGPSLGVRFKPLGAVTAHVSSSLRSSGINQSLFTVNVTLTANLRVQLAGASETVTIKNTVLLCETVVVGDVPQVYTNVANEEDMLNLIPTDVP